MESHSTNEDCMMKFSEDAILRMLMRGAEPIHTSHKVTDQQGIKKIAESIDALAKTLGFKISATTVMFDDEWLLGVLPNSSDFFSKDDPSVFRNVAETFQRQLVNDQSPAQSPRAAKQLHTLRKALGAASGTTCVDEMLALTYEGCSLVGLPPADVEETKVVSKVQKASIKAIGSDGLYLRVQGEKKIMPAKVSLASATPTDRANHLILMKLFDGEVSVTQAENGALSVDAGDLTAVIQRNLFALLNEPEMQLALGFSMPELA